MSDAEFRAFLDLMMCCDPWPVKADTLDHGFVVDELNHNLMLGLADYESKKRGYISWIEAYHEFNVVRRLP